MLDIEERKASKPKKNPVPQYKIYSIEILNLMLNKSIRDFQNPGCNGQVNSYKKRHSGIYDTGEIPGVMNEIIFSLLEGILLPRKDITDGRSFAGAIKYHLTKMVNQANKDHSGDISYDAHDDADERENFILKAWSHNRWRQESSCWRRFYPYDKLFYWLQKNDVRNLFRTNAGEIHILVQAILENPDVFTNIDVVDGVSYTLDRWEMIAHERLAQLIQERYGVPCVREAVSRDLRLLEKRLLQFLFLDLEYRVDEDGRLGKLPQSRYKRLHTQEQGELYQLCQSYKTAPARDRERIEDQIRSHEIFLQSVTDVDIDEGTDKMISSLLAYIEKMDELAIQTITDQVPTKEKYHDWEWSATADEDAVQLKLWSSREIKKPKSVELPKKDLTVYESLDDYVLADSRTSTSYWLDKSKRVIVNTNPMHENIFIPVR